MDHDGSSKANDFNFPILFIPKKCTNLETNCEATDNVYINLNITSPDTEGNETCIYTGFCNIKVIESGDETIQNVKAPNELSMEFVDEQTPVIISDQQPQLSYNQSQVWIDPVRSPFVYNRYESTDSQGCYSICHQSQNNRITVEQHNTYITKNVYNCKDAIHYSPHSETTCKKVKKQEIVQQNTSSVTQHNSSELNIYEDDEFQCGVFLSQLPEEIMHEKQTRAREELKYIGLQSENGALKQLMSTDIQSVSKQRKTILFLGHDSHCGQTIQQISYNDPSLECSGDVAEVDNEVVIENTTDSAINHKKYQCAKCQQIFDQISSFRDHMVNHPSPRYKYRRDSKSDVKFVCTDCGKHLKNQEKFELHCMGHGDPDVECNRCHKVFASKFTLRAHKKIHSRKYPCRYCSKTYARIEEMRAHLAKVHCMFMCESCDYVASKYSELILHERDHTTFSKDSSETELAESYFDDVMSESDIMSQSPIDDEDWKCDEKDLDGDDDDNSLSKAEEIRKADSVIAKVISNKMFLTRKVKKHKRCAKACDVCCKTFDRVSDLKRHLIEHVVRSTLAKTPVSNSGTLVIQCEVCQAETFTKIDRYKAHLREHAKLTLYQCTFCNKSFSDSSNFSKHKKIHGTMYFQCDLCQRKFNSKKMITQHMEYHNKHAPVSCMYCDRSFHFESMLNKHIKAAHTRELSNRFRCRFCQKYFKTLREKWDHEWSIHNARKMIVDCLICGSKFRKYAELKRHCLVKHDVEIPSAKKLLKSDN